jgi:hypothetical protein
MSGFVAIGGGIVPVVGEAVGADDASIGFASVGVSTASHTVFGYRFTSHLKKEGTPMIGGECKDQIGYGTGVAVDAGRRRTQTE